jgi:hypothetical protein
MFIALTFILHLTAIAPQPHAHSFLTENETADLAQILSHFLDDYQKIVSKKPRRAERYAPVIQAMRVKLIDLRMTCGTTGKKVQHDRCDFFIDRAKLLKSLAAPLEVALRLNYVGENPWRLHARLKRANEDLQKAERGFIVCMEQKFLPTPEDYSAMLELKKLRVTNKF